VNHSTGQAQNKRKGMPQWKLNLLFSQRIWFHGSLICNITFYRLQKVIQMQLHKAHTKLTLPYQIHCKFFFACKWLLPDSQFPLAKFLNIIPMLLHLFSRTFAARSFHDLFFMKLQATVQYKLQYKTSSPATFSIDQRNYLTFLKSQTVISTYSLWQGPETWQFCSSHFRHFSSYSPL